MCEFCDKYKKASESGMLNEELEDEKLNHDKRKVQVTEEKERDKADKNIMAITCDLQQVTTAPKLFAGSTYYK